ncbi:MAG: hypothetical protein ACPGYT_11545, partial [Nitrospirales bacterium]
RAPIQNLGEAIAQLPEEILKVSGLFAARCAAQKDGKFSSFVPGNRDGAPPGVTGFLASPLTFSTSMLKGTTTTFSPFNFSDRQETAWTFPHTTHIPVLTQGCSSLSFFHS